MTRSRTVLCLGTALMLFAFSLWAADVWQTKPYTQWSDKDLAKVANSSPWAHEVRVTPPRSQDGSSGLANQRRGGMDASNTSPMSADSGMRGSPNPDDPAGRLERGTGGDPMTEMTQTLNLTVRWQSALPMRQAQARAKFGPEVGASEEAKQFLAQTENVYVIEVFGLPAVLIGTEQIKRDALAQTALNVKGKPAIRPLKVDVNVAPGSMAGNGTMDVYFTFPRTSPIVAGDKEVDFSTVINSTPVRCSFRLRDMMFSGELAL